MAIFHLNESNISRSDGRSVVACAAYRACEKLLDHTYGNTQDYTRKKGLEYKSIYAPEHTNEKLLDRQTLWNEVEKKEFNANGSMKENARLAKEYTCALPHELTHQERIKIVDDFCRDFVKKHNVIVDACIHAPHKNEHDDETDNKNYHVHIMFTTRLVNEKGELGKKQRTFNDHGPEILKDSRATFADVVNTALENAGLEERIDHRSYKNRGLDFLEPTHHEGHKVTALRRQGIDTEISLQNDVIKTKNLDTAKQYQQIIFELDQEITVSNSSDEIARLEHELRLTKIEEQRLLAQLDKLDQEHKNRQVEKVATQKKKLLELGQAEIRTKNFHSLYANFVENFDSETTLKQQFDYIQKTQAYELAKQYCADFELLKKSGKEPRRKKQNFWQKLKGQAESPFFEKEVIEKEVNEKFFKIFFDEYAQEKITEKIELAAQEKSKRFERFMRNSSADVDRIERQVINDLFNDIADGKTPMAQDQQAEFREFIDYHRASSFEKAEKEKASKAQYKKYLQDEKNKQLEEAALQLKNQLDADQRYKEYLEKQEMYENIEYQQNSYINNVPEQKIKKEVKFEP